MSDLVPEDKKIIYKKSQENSIGISHFLDKKERYRCSRRFIIK